MLFRKILIANRGEIAVRVIRACRELDIPAVAVYSDADRASLHVRMADEAASIGPSPAASSYLAGERIIQAALDHGADAIHPGYGFLSENAEFAKSCADAGLKFIGPSAESIRLMGSKTAARTIAREAGVPILPGTDTGVRDIREARALADSIGYPVLVKAEAGGGGKGMRVVESPSDLEAALRDAGSEAERSFRSGSVYLEKLLGRPRHVEIQVLGDEYGSMIHLGERECSIQRRHQKIIEESPSPLMAALPELRDRMGQAAICAARAAGYSSAGTVEFLVDSEGQFYFLEMNTRLQVEHPVTELVTGLDLVHWQIRIAAGERLTVTQPDVRWHGSALECRLYAEDPEQNFFPSPGTIEHLRLPSGPGVRLDSGIYQGWTVPVEYDPLLAKLAVWGETREQAIRRMRRAVDECIIRGVTTNIQFFGEVLRDPCFIAGDIHTAFIDEWQRRRDRTVPSADILTAAALVAATLTSTEKQALPSAGNHCISEWLKSGRSQMLR